MRASKREQNNLPPEWKKAERLTEGIYRLHVPDKKHRYGFVFPDGTHATLSSNQPISLRDLRLLYRAELKAREARKQMEEGKFDLERFERAQQRRWEKFRRLGLLLGREEDAALSDD